MKFWIVLYSHRHGNDVWPVYQDDMPTEEEIIATLDDWEPERGEYLEIFGAFLPQAHSDERGYDIDEAYRQLDEEEFSGREP